MHGCCSFPCREKYSDKDVHDVADVVDAVDVVGVLPDGGDCL